jgi:hypothetical protein
VSNRAEAIVETLLPVLNRDYCDERTTNLARLASDLLMELIDLGAFRACDQSKCAGGDQSPIPDAIGMRPLPRIALVEATAVEASNDNGPP